MAEPSPTSWVADVIIAFLCGLGLFLLLLPCFKSNPSLAPPQKSRIVRKCQMEKRVRRRSRKKSGALKAYQDCFKELDGARSLITLLESHLGKLPDEGSSHQLFYQDPPAEVYRRAPAAVPQPQDQQVEGAAPVSPTPATEGPPPLAPASSSGLTTFPASVGPHSSLTASQPPQPFLPLKSLPCRPHAPSLPSLSPPNSVACRQPPTAFSSPPLSYSTLTTQHDSMALPLSASHIAALSSRGHSSCPISGLSWWQVAAKTLCHSTSSVHRSQQGHPSCHPSEVSFWGDPTDRQMEASSLTMLSSDDQKLLEIQITKRVQIKNWKEEEKCGPSPEQMSPEYHLNSLGNVLKSVGIEQDTTTSQTFWSMKDKPEQLLSHQQLSYPMFLGDHFQHKYKQLFWGLPSLHSESLVATAWISDGSSRLKSPASLFNGISNVCPVPMKANTSPLFSQAQSLSLLGLQSQPLNPSIHQFQPSPLDTMGMEKVQVQTQTHLHSSLLNLLPSSPPKIRDCKPQSLIPTEIQHPELPLLRKQLESEWDLPSVTQSSQKVFSPFTPNLSQDSWVVSILPENFPISPALREQLEQHIQKWLIQHQWDLPHRIQESTQDKLLETCQTKHKPESSHSFMSTRECSKEVPKVRFLLKKDPGKNLGHFLGKVPKDLSRGSKSSPGEVLRVNSQESEKYLMRSSRSDSKNDLSGSVNKNHLGNMLTLHLGLKSGQINEGLIPLSVRQSWLALNSPFSRSDTQVVTGNLALSKSWEEACTSSSQEFYFLKPCTQQMLEEHITKFRAKHKWGLPLKVLKPINVFKLKKAESLPLTLCALPSSTTCESGIDKLLVKPPQVGPREVTKESVPTLSSCLLVSSPANQEIQRALRVPSWSHDHGSSEAPPPRQERRQPSQSLSCNLVGRTRQSGTVLVAGRDSLQIRPSSTMTRNEQGKKYGDWATQDPYHSVALLEMNLGSQSLKAEETNETVPTCSILLETSVLANLQATNEKSGLETSGTSESLLLPSMSVTQKAGKPCLKTKVSVVEPSVEIKSESRTQVCDMGPLLPDCSAGMSLVEDCLATQTSQCHLQCVPMGNMPTSQVVSDHTVARKSKLRQLETGSSNHRGSWKSQSNIFTSTYKNEDCRRRNPRKHEERVEKLLTSQLTPARRIDSLESKRVQILLQKERVPSESPFKKKLRCFLHWIFCKIKGKRQEGPLQKGKLSPATAQSQGPFKTRSCVGKNTEEAQHLMTTLEQVLEKKMVLHHRIRASKLKQCKEELKGPALKFSCKRKLPLNTEQKKRSSYAACNQQATTKRQVCSLRERQVRNQQSLKNTRFWNEPRGPSHSQLLLLRKAATLANPCQHRPRMLNVSGHRHHCPRHCLVRRGVLSWQPKHFSLAFPRKICL